jgi:hypothetical protein
VIFIHFYWKKWKSISISILSRPYCVSLRLYRCFVAAVSVFCRDFFSPYKNGEKRYRWTPKPFCCGLFHGNGRLFKTLHVHIFFQTLKIIDNVVYSSCKYNDEFQIMHETKTFCFFMINYFFYILKFMFSLLNYIIKLSSL